MNAQVAEFSRLSSVLYGMTSDFARTVPDDRWDFTPVPPSDRPPALHRLGVGFAPFCKQLRHVVCVRGVYNDALETGKVDWSRKNQQYTGPLSREPLLTALDDGQARLISLLDEIDPDASTDWDGFPFSFTLFIGEFVQHEAIHHGQWSVYAALGGFDTPLSWRESWGL